MEKEKKANGKNTKYIFVVGGVMSGVGKGVSTSSIAALMQAKGLEVTVLKIDPYINVDAGTMNPTEHGEVFVLKDGLETDQDMGNYERFLNRNLPAINYMTTGSVYLSVIEKERSLSYKGRNVEVVPDIPLEVIRRIKMAGKTASADVVLVEIGGTVGEYQNVLFLEAIRMMKTESPESVATVMVSYLPVPKSIGEMKTKPTQTAVRLLNGTGVFADMIIARSSAEIDERRKEKIAVFCNVKKENVISAPDAKSIYDVVLDFNKAGLSDKLCHILGIEIKNQINLKAWQKFSKSVESEKKGVVKIAVIGKYFQSGNFVVSDVYLSILEALKYSAYAEKLTPEIIYFSASDFSKKESLKTLKNFDGVLVPGGMGESGVEEMIAVINFVRTEKIPYFGICYGMQLAVIEYSRNVLGLKDVHTSEINLTSKNLVIDALPDQKQKIAERKLGGTMRLGENKITFKKGTLAQKAYKKTEVLERHRHRFRVNPEYVEVLEEAGLVFSGKSEIVNLKTEEVVEMIELEENIHPFFIGTQYHPEFIARPLSPHPLFSAFIKKMYERQGNKK